MEPKQLDQPSPTTRGGDAAGTSAAAADVTDPPPGSYSRGRSILVNTLIGLGTVFLIVGVFAVWANRLLFSPDNWSNTSTQLLQSPHIRSATANYAVDQLYANVNVAGLIKSGLPSQLQPLAAPAAGALRNVAVQAVDDALQRPRVQAAWAKANRAADQAFIALASGGKGGVQVNQGTVTLNLSQLLDQVAVRLGLPSSVVAKIPANIGELTVLKSKQLKYVQNGSDAIRSLALWLTILFAACYALALVLAGPRRRRKLMTIGFCGVFAGVLVILAQSILTTQVTNSLTSDASLRPAINDTMSISTQMLHQIAAACIIVGIPLILAAWFAGPARPARVMREAMAPFLREHPIGTYMIALGVMVLIFIWDPIHATGTPAGIIVFTLLALVGTYALRRQTAQEFPEARSGATTARMRAWFASTRRSRSATRAATPPNGTDLPDQLRRLADLRDRGAISPGDYETAKRQLLQGSV